jgi:hypothetical protein
MIKFNEKYAINNGLGTIVFTEAKQGTVNAEYNLNNGKDIGQINGTMDDNVLKGSYHNKTKNNTGLIEITFQENGFNAKWKQGLEPGPMRGKWTALLSDGKDTSLTKLVTIEIFGRGGEVVVGDASDYMNNLNDAFDETDMEIKEIMLDSDTRSQFDLPEWYEIDNLLHINGPFPDEDCIIKISVNDSPLFNCNVSDLINTDDDQVMMLEEFYLETDDNTIYTGVAFEKGCLFSGYINISEDESFDIDQLKLYSKEIMVNDESIALCIYKIEYKGEEVENVDFSTNGQGFHFDLHS